jgi:plastocyanin domain-containing protein
MNAMLLAVLLSAASAPSATPPPDATPAKASASPAGSVPATPALPTRTIKMTVTKKGFVPAQIKVKKGQPLHMLITRKTDETCATEIEIQEAKISTDLPLNKEVAVDFTPTTSGEVRYACGMGMVSGVLLVD